MILRAIEQSKEVNRTLKSLLFANAFEIGQNRPAMNIAQVTAAFAGCWSRKNGNSGRRRSPRLLVFLAENIAHPYDGIDLIRSKT